MHTSQGAIVAKAALARSGVIAHPTVRLPLVEDPAAVVARLDDLLARRA
jgi:4-hydroxy-tetrahydrodipicolinate synthase